MLDAVTFNQSKGCSEQFSDSSSQLVRCYRRMSKEQPQSRSVDRRCALKDMFLNLSLHLG
jgi:hypothetical protein